MRAPILLALLAVGLVVPGAALAQGALAQGSGLGRSLGPEGLPEMLPELREAGRGLSEEALEGAQDAELRRELDEARDLIRARAEALLAERTGIGQGRPVVEPTEELLVFTHAACPVCGEGMHRELTELVRARPELRVSVYVLGDPTRQVAHARELGPIYYEDLLAQWLEAAADPGLRARMQGEIVDRRSRVSLRFSNTEAERRGLAEVPAFVARGPRGEVTRVGRPASVLESVDGLLALVGERGAR